MALYVRNGGSIYTGMVAPSRRTDGSIEPGIFSNLYGKRKKWPERWCRDTRMASPAFGFSVFYFSFGYGFEMLAVGLLREIQSHSPVQIAFT